MSNDKDEELIRVINRKIQIAIWLHTCLADYRFHVFAASDVYLIEVEYLMVDNMRPVMALNSVVVFIRPEVTAVNYEIAVKKRGWFAKLDYLSEILIAYKRILHAVDEFYPHRLHRYSS